MSLPVEVVQAVEQHRCLLFLGSRASAEAAEEAGQEFLSAAALAKQLGWKPPRRLMGGRAQHVTASVEQGAALFQDGQGRDALLRELKRQRGLGGVVPTQAHTLALAHFPVIYTTCWDDLLARAGAAAGLTVQVRERGDPAPTMDPDVHVVVAWRGGFQRPEGLLVTAADLALRPEDEARKTIRRLIHDNTVLFVGFRPDEEEFERLWEELTDVYGGELPRCHMAVAQGRMDDFLWQKWVWRGLLLFTADPVECLQDLATRRQAVAPTGA